jgi:WxcM-like protein
MFIGVIEVLPTQISDASRKCRLVDLPKIVDPRGNLTFIEGGRQISFDIKRVFYLYDVPGGAMRAGHALKSCHQFLIAASGSFDVMIDDGFQKQRFYLNRSYYGLHIPPLIWREIDNFSSGSVCVVLASEIYDEAGYYREYGQFLDAVKGNFDDYSNRRTILKDNV